MVVRFQQYCNSIDQHRTYLPIRSHAIHGTHGAILEL